jgi:hypothetical protein
MIVNFDEFINEELNFKQKIKDVVNYPIIKYIERKTKDMTDEEKLQKIAEIARKIDRIFSAPNSFHLIYILAGIYTPIGLKYVTGDEDINYIFLIFVVTHILYNSLSKRYRLLAKDSYAKIRNEYVKKFIKPSENDPYGEEHWDEEEEDVLRRSDDIRYRVIKNGFYRAFTKIMDDYPYIGLGKKRDIRH